MSILIFAIASILLYVNTINAFKNIKTETNTTKNVVIGSVLIMVMIYCFIVTYNI